MGGHTIKALRRGLAGASGQEAVVQHSSDETHHPQYKRANIMNAQIMGMQRIRPSTIVSFSQGVFFKTFRKITISRLPVILRYNSRHRPA